MLAAMRYGVSIFLTDTSIRPDDVAREAERRGFESLWLPEHSHIPTSRRTPWGGREGAPPLPEHYWRTLDQFGALSWAAAATDELMLGAGVALVAQRDPIWTAKEFATLDHLSGGRALLGIGYGWNREEMAHHGVAYGERRQVLREKVLAMRALWTEEEAEFHGDHVDFESSWAWPKPAQDPHPPVLMGAAAGPRTIGDMVEFCDGWMPLSGRHDLAGNVETVKAAVSEAGRDPDRFQIVAYQAKPDHVPDLRAAGTDRAVFGLPSADHGTVVAELDRIAREVGL